MKHLQRILVVTLLAIPVCAIGSPANSSASAPIPRERLLMDFGWKFHLGNDWGIGQGPRKGWRGLWSGQYGLQRRELAPGPAAHDWAIELPFDAKGRRLARIQGARHCLSAEQRQLVSAHARSCKGRCDRRIWLEFDGVFRDSTVFVNGWFVGHHESGYTSFRYDITDVVKFGEKNLVAVRVDATQTEGWFYEGAGIYRHVWLVKTAPVAIAPDGIFVTSSFTNNTPTGPAKVHVQTDLRNAQPAPASVVVGWEILAPDGQGACAGPETGACLRSGVHHATVRRHG